MTTRFAFFLLLSGSCLAGRVALAQPAEPAEAPAQPPSADEPPSKAPAAESESPPSDAPAADADVSEEDAARESDTPQESDTPRPDASETGDPAEPVEGTAAEPADGGLPSDTEGSLPTAPKEGPGGAPAPGAAPAEEDAPVAEQAPPDFEIVEVEVGDAPAGEVEAVAEGEGVSPEAAAIEVSVAGVRVARTAGSAHVLGPVQLERFEYDDPHAALLQVPGVYVRQEDGVGLRPNISLRGVNPDRSKKVTLMEDGILFGPAPYSAPAAYYFPLTTRMYALRVVKGPSTVAYGPQTVGGGIDYVTRPIPTSTEGFADIGVGQYGYRKAHMHFGSSTEQVGFLVEGVRLHSDGFKELDGGGDTGFTRNEWMLKASYVVDPTARILHTFRLKAGYSDEASNETYLGLTDADFPANPNRRYAASQLDRMEYRRTQVVASYQLEVPGRNLQLTTTAYRHDLTRSWNKLNSFASTRIEDVLAAPEASGNDDFYEVLAGETDSIGGLDTLLIGPNQRDFVSQGVQGVLSGSAITGPIGHRYEAGVRVHNDSITRRHSQSGYLMNGGALYPDGGPEQVTTANEGTTLALAVHAIDTLTWQDLSITAGVRTELIWSELRDRLGGTLSTATTAVGLPGLGVFYELLDGFGVLAGVYRGFSPPPPGDADAQPENSINYEVGARYDEGPARAEAIGFVNDYSNLTALCTFSAGCDDVDIDSQISAGAALTYGLELYAGHAPRVGSWSFPMTAAYTFTRSEFRTSFDSTDRIFGTVERGDPMPYIPGHQLNLTGGVEHAAASLVASFTYVDAMPEGPVASPIDGSVYTDELFVLDLSGTVKLAKRLDFYANLRNATNYQAIVGRRPFGARPNAPLWFQAGIKGHL